MDVQALPGLPVKFSRENPWLNFYLLNKKCRRVLPGGFFSYQTSPTGRMIIRPYYPTRHFLTGSNRRLLADNK
jgi:hypothetical protein